MHFPNPSRCRLVYSDQRVKALKYIELVSHMSLRNIDIVDPDGDGMKDISFNLFLLCVA